MGRSPWLTISIPHNIKFPHTKQLFPPQVIDFEGMMSLNFSDYFRVSFRPYQSGKIKLPPQKMAVFSHNEFQKWEGKFPPTIKIFEMKTMASE